MEKELRLPMIGEFVRHVGKLVKIEDIILPPPQPERDYIFEEIEAVCELLYKGETIKSLGTYNDFYGIGTSVQNAIKEMKDYASERQIGKNSELEVRVTQVVSQTRMKPNGKYNVYAKEFSDFEYKSFGSKANLPEPIKTIVWSSKMEGN
jgi:hypothetical protein